jgi:hypothetical protein
MPLTLIAPKRSFQDDHPLCVERHKHVETKNKEARTVHQHPHTIGLRYGCAMQTLSACHIHSGPMQESHVDSPLASGPYPKASTAMRYLHSSALVSSFLLSRAALMPLRQVEYFSLEEERGLVHLVSIQQPSYWETAVGILDWHFARTALRNEALEKYQPDYDGHDRHGYR